MAWLRKVKSWGQDQRGVGLVESLIAVAILGTAVVAFIMALSSGAVAVREGNQQVVAQSLVRTQLEYIKSFPLYDSEATTYPYVYTYDETYNPNPITLPEGYTISVEVDSIPDADGDIQKITVTISLGDENILTVEDYKVDRL